MTANTAEGRALAGLTESVALARALVHGERAQRTPTAAVELEIGEPGVKKGR